MNSEDINISYWNDINSTYENGFATIDDQWNIIYVNEAAQKLLAPATIQIGSSFWTSLKKIIPSRIERQYADGHFSGLPETFVNQCAGEYAWYIAHAYCSDKEVSVHFQSVRRSFSENARLMAIAELYSFVSELSKRCLWDWNLNTKEIFWVDGGHRRLFGYKIENTWLPQSFWENRIHPDDKIHLVQQLTALERGDGNSQWDCEYRFQNSVGEYCYVHASGHVFRDASGKPNRILGVTAHESEKYQSKRKLEETEKKLSLIVQQTVNGIVITNEKNSISYSNNGFTQITGYQFPEVQGTRLEDFLFECETHIQTIEYLNQCINKGLSFDCEILLCHKDASPRWSRLQGQSLNEMPDNNRSYFLVFTDITEQKFKIDDTELKNKLSQNAIAEAVLTALEKERIEIGREIHDNLNHTLVASKLYIDLAKTNDSNQSQYLEKSSQYIAHVIESIRRISKKLVTPDLMGLESSIVCLIEDLMLVYPVTFIFSSKHVKENELNDKLKLNIFRIVQEQLTNIVKHSGANKSKIRLSKVNDHINIVIQDNGVGCDLSKKPGGVGLRNIQSRAAMFDGGIKLKSSPGCGFVLTVELLATKICND